MQDLRTWVLAHKVGAQWFPRKQGMWFVGFLFLDFIGEITLSLNTEILLFNFNMICSHKNNLGTFGQI